MVSFEKDATLLMQRWISDEFTFLSCARDQGVSTFDEERRIRQELQLPEFNGKNYEFWISELEETFNFFQLNEEAKLKAAILSLDGEAQQWFERENKLLRFFDWEELKWMVLQCFGLSKTTQGELDSGGFRAAGSPSCMAVSEVEEVAALDTSLQQKIEEIFTSFAQDVARLVKEKLAEGFAELRSEFQEIHSEFRKIRKGIEAEEIGEGEEVIVDLGECKKEKLPSELFQEKEREIVVVGGSVFGSDGCGERNHKGWRNTQAEREMEVEGGCLSLEKGVVNPHLTIKVGTGCGSGGGPGCYALTVVELSVDGGKGGFDGGTTVCGGLSEGMNESGKCISGSRGSAFGLGYYFSGGADLAGGEFAAGVEKLVESRLQKKIPEVDGGMVCDICAVLEEKTQPEIIISNNNNMVKSSLAKSSRKLEKNSKLVACDKYYSGWGVALEKEEKSLQVIKKGKCVKAAKKITIEIMYRGDHSFVQHLVLIFNAEPYRCTPLYCLRLTYHSPPFFNPSSKLIGPMFGIIHFQPNTSTCNLMTQCLLSQPILQPFFNSSFSPAKCQEASANYDPP